MYIDTVLFITGGVCALLALLLIIYLVTSYKKSKEYHAVLEQDTEVIDVLTTTGFLTHKTKEIESVAESTEALSEDTVSLYLEASSICEDDSTELLREQPKTINFNASALEGRYILKSEIHRGGMSRIFLADSAKLGNQWIVKFISNQTGKLANEENILKLLNHISLPKIIDIFRDDKGVYLVESFVEGVALDEVLESMLESGQKLNQAIILDWAEQLAQVLNYLHRMEPHPIYHYDLKPSNIMVTHDNRLVLIDFGISKRFGEDDAEVIGVTYKYAAPEQLKHRIADKHMPLIESRFGELPADRMNWSPDARTDIYGLGVILFELAVGQTPTIHNMNTLKEAVSYEFFKIISKCLAVDPADRYQSTSELLTQLQKIKASKIRMARTLFMRKLAYASCAIAIIVSGTSLTGGYYVYAQENAALLSIRPEIMTVSLQQSSDLAVEKKMASGKIILLDNSQIRWALSKDNIARVDGNRVSGINLGETKLSGRYRNKNVSLDVRVVPPMDGMVDISQHYQIGHTIKVFAGTTNREHNDGQLSNAEFVSPESIAVAADGTIYVVDSGLMRTIKGNQVESTNFNPDFLTPRIVRCYKNDVYVLTNEWEDEEGVYYGIIKLSGESAEGLYIADAMYTAVEDFSFSREGLIYYIDRNAGVDGVFLKTLDPANVEDIKSLCELPKGTASLTIDEEGAVYLANPETGVIHIWKEGKLNYFAGVENEKAFIDGAAPLFYMPQKLKYSNNSLFIWDYNTLRRISIKDGVASDCITIAGEASPNFNLDIKNNQQAAEEIILPNSRQTDFAVKGKGIILTDPKRGVMWRVE